MALFSFGKKKEAAACACSISEVTPITCDYPSAADGQPCRIKVLGTGCKTCHQQYVYVRAAIAAMGLNTEAEYITDVEKVMAYGAMSMPALVVNESVVSSGKLLKENDVVRLLRRMGF